jgi:2-amino-4-hydroxy-6-hydroxymethyldihydropteridine diphosphokinase
MLAVLSLGSNSPLVAKTGEALEPFDILHAACARLSERLGGLRVSSVYRTKPLYYENQRDFYNLVCAGTFTAKGTESDSTQELLAFTQSVEALFGRDRTREIPKGPRTLDIDIVLLGNCVISTPELTIPHPGAKERAFVLVPLLEILPESADPISGRKYRSFLDDITTRGVELIHGNRI